MKPRQTQSMLSEFGKRLRELRQQRGLSQADLGKKVRIGSKTILLYEQGKMAPTLEVIARLARFFSVSADDLIFNDEARMKSVRDRDLIECLIQADLLPRRERALIKDLVEVLLVKHQAGHAPQHSLT